MTINPRDYDLDELREMARRKRPNGHDADETLNTGTFDPADIDVAFEEEESVSAGSSFRAGLYRELLPFLGGGNDKPYLQHLPESYTAEFVIFEWLEFLIMHSGYKGTGEALDFYESIEWITEEVQSDLADYLLAIDDASTNGENELGVDGHMLSLVYVAKLTSMA